MSRRVLAVLAAGVAVATATPGQAEPLKVRYVAYTGMGYTDLAAAAEPTLGVLGPTDADGHTVLRPSGTSITVTIEDTGADAGETVWVQVSQQRSPRPPLSTDLCIRAGTPHRITGLAAGRWLHMRVMSGVTGQIRYPTTGRCTAFAVQGTLTIEGATWVSDTFYNAEPSPNPKYPERSGCDIALSPGASAGTCHYTATNAGGWSTSASPQGAAPTITLVLERKGKKLTYRDVCRTNLIRVGDRVSATITRPQGSISHYTLQTGSGHGCP